MLISAKDPFIPATTAFNLKTRYDYKYGARKMFFKYYYVNAATGEKMASAELS